MKAIAISLLQMIFSGRGIVVLNRKGGTEYVENDSHDAEMCLINFIIFGLTCAGFLV